MSLKPRPVPHTVRKLLSLTDGERFTFYSGNFEADIKRSLRDQQTAPYALALLQIRDTSRELANKKRVALEATKQGKVSIGGNLVTMYTYTATGLPAGQ